MCKWSNELCLRLAFRIHLPLTQNTGLLVLLSFFLRCIISTQSAKIVSSRTHWVSSLHSDYPGYVEGFNLKVRLSMIWYCCPLSVLLSCIICINVRYGIAWRWLQFKCGISYEWGLCQEFLSLHFRSMNVENTLRAQHLATQRHLHTSTEEESVLYGCLIMRWSQQAKVYSPASCQGHILLEQNFSVGQSVMLSINGAAIWLCVALTWEKSMLCHFMMFVCACCSQGSSVSNLIKNHGNIVAELQRWIFSLPLLDHSLFWYAYTEHGCGPWSWHFSVHLTYEHSFVQN